MKWSELLIKKSVEGFLFDPLPSDTVEDRTLLAELCRLCCRELTTLQSVRQLKAELKKLTKSRVVSDRVREVLEDVRDELEEILNDLRFERSQRGRFVLFFNDWAQELYRTIRPQPRFADAYVMADASRQAVIVTGHVPDEAALRDLRSIIDAHSPGVEVIWNVTFGQPQ